MEDAFKEGLAIPGVLSVLDRLGQDNPKEDWEWPMTRVAFERRLTESVKENLEWLLNTRRIAAALPGTYESLRESIFYYGLPDLTNVSVASSRQRDQLLKEIESTVCLFEPRLGRVKVLHVEGKPMPQMLSFRIEAMLLIDPAPKPILFNVEMDLANQNCQLKGPE
jgi:type VI secretion system protein ImpF